MIEIGLRIPKNFFETIGKGESNITVHAGSYHLALKNAGIEMTNILTYSSILPSIAEKVPKPEYLVHGAVLECIMAVGHTTMGKRVTAGIIYGWLHHKSTGKRYGGLVCEHNGAYTLEEIDKLLRLSIQELYTNGFSEEYDLKDITVLKDSFVPKKRYGTVLVALCFTTHIIPVLKGKSLNNS